MEKISTSDFERLLVDEISMESVGNAAELLYGVDTQSRVEGATLFLQNILDHVADYEYRYGDGSFLAACTHALERIAGAPDDINPTIRGTIALITLNAKLLDRRFKSPDMTQQAEADEYCRLLFDDTPIRDAIRAIYHPEVNPTDSTNSFEISRWEELDFTSLYYHKAGTTSFILRASTLEPIDESGARRQLAVKCVLFPWNKVAAIAQATDDYALRYGGRLTPHVVVHPIASSRRWVLMPFQDGLTLAEQLAELEAPPINHARGHSPADRVTKARDIARHLTTALHQLAGGQPVDTTHPNRQHLDLSPSNILLEPGSNEIRFIDLGVNHLYSRQVGIAEHDDSVFTAPEIKNQGSSATADAYSVGIILIRILAGYAPRDGRVPTKVWKISPLLARALDDLIEEDFRRRLLLRSEKEEFSFAALGALLDHTFELAMTEPEASTGGLAPAENLIHAGERGEGRSWDPGLGRSRRSPRNGRARGVRRGMMAGCALATGVLDSFKHLRGSASASGERSGQGHRDLGPPASDRGAGTPVGRAEGPVHPP